MKSALFPLGACVMATLAFAQAPDPGASSASQVPVAPQAQPAAQPAGQPAGASSSGGGSSFLGKDMPMFDPGSEMIMWDGKSWNINNNRIFKARFEKYLNAPEETTADEKKYNLILKQILDALSPNNISPKSIDTAFKQLGQASQYDIDAKLCETIANQVYSSWLARKSNDRVNTANQSLAEELKRLEWNVKMAAESSSLESSAPKEANAAAEWQKQRQLRRDLEVQPMLTRMAEINALLKSNGLKKEVLELQVKIEFQAMIVQLFMQRRFQHVVIATRFYRSIFNDGGSQLNVGEDARNLFSKTTGMPPTVGTVDAMANEVMRDVSESVKAFEFLLEKKELQSASERLMEGFLIGEYMPDIRTLTREKKRQALDFVQKSNKLISAIDVKDYTLAEQLVKDLDGTAKDFDNSKPMAAIETARTVSAMHIAKARNAAMAGDNVTLETELKAATEIWPRNPALSEVATSIFAQGDTQARALVDLEQLVSQKNYRQIYDDRMRFIPAVAMNQDKRDQLQNILENMQIIEGAIIRAQEIEKRGDFNGAWESTELAFQQFSNDNKLNLVRADLTSKAAEFVRALRQAEELEKKKQPGSSLAWYLKAQKIYQPSEFAREGIERIKKEILPDAT